MAINVKVTITIGTRYGKCAGSDYGKIAPVEDIQWARRWIPRDTATIVGGATFTEGTGVWYDDNNQPVEETVLTVVAYTTNEKVYLLRHLVALHWKKYFQQDAVLFVVEPVLDIEFV